MTEYDLGKVVGDDGQDGVDGSDGSTIWYTSTAPTYANSKYTFTISDLSGKTGFSIAVSDLIFYDTYYYVVSAVGSTTVDCATRVNIKGSDASVTVVDNLNSDSSTSVLSAKQGKVLNTNKVETSAIVTSFSSTTSDSKVASEKLVKTELDKKIATSSTTGLVKNDGSIMASGTGSSNWAVGNHTHSAYVNPTKVTSWSSTPSDNNVASEKLIKDSLDDKVSKSNTSGLLKNDGTVDTTSYSTFSGSYSDLSNKPSIPSSSSDLSDGSSLVKTSSISGLLKNDGTVDTSSYITSSAITGKEDTNNKVTSWSSTVNDTHYPSEKLVKDSLDSKQATLVSGTSLKTVNNESLLGSGNITIQGGGGSYINDFYGDSSTNELIIDYDTGVSQADIVTSWSSTTSDSNVPSEKLVKNYIDNQIGTAIQYIQQ